MKEKSEEEQLHKPVAMVDQPDVNEEMSKLSEAILAAANSLRKGRKIYQAIDMYFRLVEDFPSTKDANLAAEQLFSLAKELEAKGKAYLALGIYNRMENPHYTTAAGKAGYMLSPMGRSVGTPLLGKIVGSIL